MDNEREEMVEAVADAAENTDPGSVLPRRRILNRLHGGWQSLTSTQREKAFGAYYEEVLSRRDFLKLLGVIGAGSIVATTGLTHFFKNYDSITGRQVAGANSGDFQTWKVPSGAGAPTVPGEYWNGDTLENLLIDQTASNASGRVIADAGKTIRNVGWKGLGDSSGKYFLALTGNDVTIDAVHIEGAANNKDYMGMWASPKINGTFTVKNSYVARGNDNGMYLEAPAKSGGSGGKGIVDACFTINNIRGHYRMGAGFELSNSVAVSRGSIGNEIPSAANGGTAKVGMFSFYQPTGGLGPVQATNVHCSFPNGQAFRSLHNQWDLSDCEMEGTLTNENLIVSGPSSYGNSPETEPPNTVPCTPEEAASGSV